MIVRPSSSYRLLMLMLVTVPALFGCKAEQKQEVLPALSKEALAAVDPRPDVSREKLARRIDALFLDNDAGETRALLVLHNGRIIAERYGAAYTKNSRLPGWSMTKTVTAVLIGMLVGDGRMRLDDPADIPAWQRAGDPRGEITLRHLLQMRSGLKHAEKGDAIYETDQVRMLFLDGRDDMAAYAEAQPLEAEPGKTYEYSTATSVILADLAARALTGSKDPAQRQQAVTEYLQSRVLDPIGMRTAVPEFDAAGTFIGGSMLHATARDWGNFGEFLRNDGTVKGARLLKQDWVDFMISPSSANKGYGAQIWLNRKQPDGKVVLFPDSAPATLFACTGYAGQYVIVSPQQKLTIVRLGKSDGVQHDVLRERLAALVKVFPRN